MGEELDLLTLGREPFELGVVDDVIQRQEAAEIGVGIGGAAVPDDGNLQRLVDGLVGNPACERLAVGWADAGNGFFHGMVQVPETLNEACAAGVMGVKKGGVLGAGEHAAVEADHRDPLGILRGPSEGFKVFFPASQMNDHGVSLSQRTWLAYRPASVKLRASSSRSASSSEMSASQP